MATLKVEGKGRRQRVVPLTQSAIAALKLYLEEARSLFSREAGQVRLFVSTRSGGPLDDDDIVRIVAKAANRAGIRKHVTPIAPADRCRSVRGFNQPCDLWFIQYVRQWLLRTKESQAFRRVVQQVAVAV